MQILQLTWVNGNWRKLGLPLEPVAAPLSVPELEELCLPWNSCKALGIVFGPSEFLEHHAPFDILRAMLPDLRWIGASSQGSIAADQFCDEALLFTLVRFERVQMELLSEHCSDIAASYDVARSLGAGLLARGALTAMIVLADGLKTAGYEVLRGLLDGGAGASISGGMASDGVYFHRTWVMHNGLPTQGAISVLGFYGDEVQVRQACNSGAVVFGPNRRVTASRGAELLELDGRPALQVYRDYLGAYADQLPASAAFFPLAMRRSRQDEAVVMRFVLSIDETSQGLRLAGDIPKGSYVQFSRATHQQLFQAAGAASLSAANALGASPSGVLSLVVSCAGRRVCLGERTGEDLESVLAEMPPGSVQTGFFSYGEFASRPGQAADVHNMTMAVIAIAESAPVNEVVEHA